MTTKRKRPQTQKQRNKGTGNPDRLALILRGGDGAHGNPQAYKRAPKHKGRGWDE